MWRLLLNESTKKNVVEFSKPMNLKHCIYKAVEAMHDTWENLTMKKSMKCMDQNLDSK
jgi:hypothetical protein